MKFEHQLTFNAHPAWKDAYINYSKLKALIYEAERHAAAAAAARASGDARLADDEAAAAASVEAAFRRAVDVEAAQVLGLFQGQGE